MTFEPAWYLQHTLPSRLSNSKPRSSKFRNDSDSEDDSEDDSESNSESEGEDESECECSSQSDPEEQFPLPVPFLPFKQSLEDFDVLACAREAIALIPTLKEARFAAIATHDRYLQREGCIQRSGDGEIVIKSDGTG